MFNCTKCGECCRHIDRVPELSKFDDGNGVCIHLKGNLCDIYYHRPVICNVDRMYELYFANEYLKDDFYKINENACEIIKSHKSNNAV